jgi:hypothetical protein
MHPPPMARRVGEEPARGDRPIEVLATSQLGYTHLVRGEFSNAATLLERNAALRVDRHLMVPQCRVAGDYDGALRFGQEALTIARALMLWAILVVFAAPDGFLLWYPAKCRPATGGISVRRGR